MVKIPKESPEQTAIFNLVCDCGHQARVHAGLHGPCVDCLRSWEVPYCMEFRPDPQVAADAVGAYNLAVQPQLE